MLEWVTLGPLNEAETDFSKYSKDIGVYRARLNDVVVYIGKATELNNGGFRKRLRDYTRKSDSARNYPSGRMMYENRNKVIIDIIIAERSGAGIIFTERLEIELITEHKPAWNNLDNK